MDKFFPMYIIYCQKKRSSIKKNILGFIGSSLIAGGLSGYLLIPVVLSLMTGKASLKNLSDGIYVTSNKTTKIAAK